MLGGFRASIGGALSSLDRGRLGRILVEWYRGLILPAQTWQELEGCRTKESCYVAADSHKYKTVPGPSFLVFMPVLCRPPRLPLESPGKPLVKARKT